jgi:hypothetical protein
MIASVFKERPKLFAFVTVIVVFIASLSIKKTDPQLITVSHHSNLDLKSVEGPVRDFAASTRSFLIVNSNLFRFYRVFSCLFLPTCFVTRFLSAQLLHTLKATMTSNT